MERKPNVYDTLQQVLVRQRMERSVFCRNRGAIMFKDIQNEHDMMVGRLTDKYGDTFETRLIVNLNTHEVLAMDLVIVELADIANMIDQDTVEQLLGSREDVIKLVMDVCMEYQLLVNEFLRKAQDERLMQAMNSKDPEQRAFVDGILNHAKRLRAKLTKELP